MKNENFYKTFWDWLFWVKNYAFVSFIDQFCENLQIECYIIISKHRENSSALPNPSTASGKAEWIANQYHSGEVWVTLIF